MDLSEPTKALLSGKRAFLFLGNYGEGIFEIIFSQIRRFLRNPFYETVYPENLPQADTFLFFLPNNIDDRASAVSM